MLLLDHLRKAAVAANRECDIKYYLYHLWIAFISGNRLVYLGIMSYVHAVIPPIYGGFGLAKMLVKTINSIRVSIPDWEGWKELDNWDTRKK